MHFVVSWDISASGDEWTRLNNQLKDKLSTYSWARPLTTFYVVNVSSHETWNSILSSLAGVCKENPGKINFIMTPLMSGGRYNGFLDKKMWDEINKRSM